MDSKDEVKNLVFSGRHIPVKEASKIMDKDQQFIRQAMIKGLLPIGLAFKMDNSSTYSYYISPKLFYEYTGYMYEPEPESEAEEKD